MFIHIVVLLIASFILAIAGKRKQAGMYFLSLLVVLLIGYPACTFLLS
jgi:hypothetical protein